MVTARRYAYLHGFASGAASRKGQLLAARFRDAGAELALSDLNVPSSAQLTVTGALSAIDALTAGDDTWSFIGSSLGGYLAALWAAQHPRRVAQLVLLCPGFDLTARWPALLGADAITAWRAHGARVFPDGAGVPTPVHWGFVEDALLHPPTPPTPCPTLVIHGTQDTVVPIQTSRAYAAAHDTVRLIEVDDGHELTGSVRRIGDEAVSFFDLAAATPCSSS